MQEFYYITESSNSNLLPLTLLYRIINQRYYQIFACTVFFGNATYIPVRLMYESLLYWGLVTSNQFLCWHCAEKSIKTFYYDLGKRRSHSLDCWSIIVCHKHCGISFLCCLDILVLGWRTLCRKPLTSRWTDRRKNRDVYWIYTYHREWEIILHCSSRLQGQWPKTTTNGHF